MLEVTIIGLFILGIMALEKLWPLVKLLGKLFLLALLFEIVFGK